LSWDDIVGHEAVKAYLRRLIKSGRVAHAYALVGREGIGKTLMALAFAQALLCPATKGRRPLRRVPGVPDGKPRPAP